VPRAIITAAMDADERKHWIALTRVPQIGAARVRLLQGHFGSLAVAWTAGEGDLREAGLDARATRSVLNERGKIDPDAELALLEKHGCTAITWQDPDYPPRLKEVDDSPPVLYMKGELLPGDERSVAVVGTRRVTAYGREVAHRLSRDLAEAGVVVVSGLASGVDGIAHRAALEAGKRTIAVLGSGIDNIYPREHTRLAEQISSSGAVISEHPIGTKPKAEHFPRRNRILSGMTLGTLVIEAGESSGALITARHAVEQNREVFAVPGSIMSPNSRGTNGLIQRLEAKLVHSHEDILEELNLSFVGKQIEMAALFPASDEESKILFQLGHEPTHIDEIIRGSGMTISAVSGLLAMMELRGLVRQVGGMNYVRA
jgi:DNA processing protein